MLAQSEITGAAIKGCAAAVASQAAIAVWQEIGEYLASNAYSKSQLMGHRALKEIYQDAFSDEPPEYWALDSYHRPRYMIKRRHWQRTLEKHVQHQDSLGQLHHYIKTFALLATGFLEERRHNRYFDAGFPGDLVEQYFTENIHWALNELSTYRLLSSDILRISVRCQYMQAVNDSDLIFRHGYITHRFTHINTNRKMFELLTECIGYMKKMQALSGARESLCHLKTSCEEYLGACFDYLYRSRGSFVTVPMTMANWRSFNQADRLALDKNHDGLFQTHTGLMLQELIMQIGCEAFGALEEGLQKPHKAVYLNNRGYLHLFHNSMASGAPLWLQGARHLELRYLVQYLQISEILCVFSRIHRCIREAYELTGLSGDSWACGKLPGRAAIELMLAFLSKQLTQAQAQLSGLHQFSELYRKSYFKQHRADASKQYYKCWQSQLAYYNLSQQLHQVLHAAMRDLSNKVAAFPSYRPEALGMKTRQFYTSLTGLVTRYCPTLRDKSVKLTKMAALPEQAAPLSQRFSYLKSAQRIQTLGLVFRLLHINGYAFFQNDRALLAKDLAELVKPWRLGDDYHLWRMGFVHRQLNLFRAYNRSCEQIEKGLADGVALSTLIDLRDKASTILQLMLDILEAEKPRWRFQFWFVPIQTMGWPFNREASQFYHQVRAKCLLKRQKLYSCLAEIKGSAETTTISELPHKVEVMISEQAQATRRASANESLAVFLSIMRRITMIAEGKSTTLIPLTHRIKHLLAKHAAKMSYLQLLRNLESRDFDHEFKKYISEILQLLSQPKITRSGKSFPITCDGTQSSYPSQFVEVSQPLQNVSTRI